VGVLKVTVNVAVRSSDPEVAVTVTMYEAGGGPLEDPEPPPQPETRPSQAKVVSSKSMCSHSLFFRLKEHRSPARTATEIRLLPFLSSAAPEAGTVTDSVVVANALEVGVTVVGEKKHVAPEGNPEQEKEITELMPPHGVTVIVASPE
jgi:hypothetical protein